MLKKVQEKLMLVQELTLSTKETLPQPTSSDELYSFFAITPLSASSISDDTLAEDENDYDEEKRMKADFLFRYLDSNNKRRTVSRTANLHYTKKGGKPLIDCSLGSNLLSVL